MLNSTSSICSIVIFRPLVKQSAHKKGAAVRTNRTAAPERWFLRENYSADQ